MNDRATSADGEGRAVSAGGNAGAAAESPGLSLASSTGRWVLAATVVGSGMAFLDSTVVNVALPHIGEDLDASVSGLQWVINAYLVTLSALILLGGSLGDRFGRRRVFVCGVIWFAAASVACALAPNVPALVVARVLQGVGGAMLTPGSLAILEASFRTGERARAIGAWSGLSGVTAALGPFVGGWLVDAASWRWIFLINVPLAAGVVLVAWRHVPETLDPAAPRQLDLAGAILMGVALGGLSWGLIAAGDGWGVGQVGALLVGATGLLIFGLLEARSPHPMVPPRIFSSAQFRAANLVTGAVYAALGVVFFLLVVHLQQVLGYSALEAGAATLPITLLMLALSARSGALAQRIGPRLQMSVGPLVLALGVLWMRQIEAGDPYVWSVLGPVLVAGLGLAATVAPLTATAMAAVEERHAGIASGVNTTVARAAQLAAVAAVPLAAGITGDVYLDPAAFAEGFRTAMFIGAALAATGGVVALATVRNPAPGAEGLAVPEPAEVAEGVAATPAPATLAAVGRGSFEPRFHCSVDAPPLHRCPRSTAGAGGGVADGEAA